MYKRFVEFVSTKAGEYAGELAKKFGKLGVVIILVFLLAFVGAVAIGYILNIIAIIELLGWFGVFRAVGVWIPIIGGVLGYF